jgi:hypothetical protein
MAKILVIEDNAAMTLATFHLESVGHTILSARYQELLATIAAQLARA